MIPARLWARAARTALKPTRGPDYLTWPGRAAVAFADVADDVLKPRGKPAWGIKMRRDAASLLDDLIGCRPQARSTDRSGARSIGAAAEGYAIRITLN